jgi:hypothetical protein
MVYRLTVENFMKKLNNLFMGIALNFLKSKTSYLVGDIKEDGKIKFQFGVAVWSKDGETMNVITFYLGLKNRVVFCDKWDDFVSKRLMTMLNKREDTYYLPANSEEEAINIIVGDLHKEVA